MFSFFLVLSGFFACHCNFFHGEFALEVRWFAFLGVCLLNFSDSIFILDCIFVNGQ